MFDVRGVVIWSLSTSSPIYLWGEESCREETQCYILLKILCPFNNLQMQFFLLNFHSKLSFVFSFMPFQETNYQFTEEEVENFICILRFYDPVNLKCYFYSYFCILDLQSV